MNGAGEKFCFFLPCYASYADWNWGMDITRLGRRVRIRRDSLSALRRRQRTIDRRNACRPSRKSFHNLSDFVGSDDYHAQVATRASRVSKLLANIALVLAISTVTLPPAAMLWPWIAAVGLLWWSVFVPVEQWSLPFYTSLVVPLAVSALLVLRRTNITSRLSAGHS